MALCLGTAQLGQDYGIFKKPNKEKSFSILEAAVDGGIEYIDTAPMYGEAQSLIGTFLHANGLKMKVVTKIPSYKGHDGKEFIDWCKRSASDSIRTLGIGQVWAVLIHDSQNAKDFPREMMGLRVWFTATGLVRKFGVSLYDPEDLAHRLMGIYQFPLNLKDTRWLRQVPVTDMVWTGNTIMVRSIYLQGRIQERAQSMAFVKKAIEQRTKNFIIVVGAESPNQIQENVQLYRNPYPIDVDKVMTESRFSTAEEIDPRRWK